MVQKRGSRRSKRKRITTNTSESANTSSTNTDTVTSASHTAANPNHPAPSVVRVSQAYYWNGSTSSMIMSDEEITPPSPYTIDQFIDTDTTGDTTTTIVTPESTIPSVSLLWIWNAIKHNTSLSTPMIQCHHPTPIQLQAWSILRPVPPISPYSRKTSNAEETTTTTATAYNQLNNAILIAPTGSGKTYAYLIPIILQCCFDSVPRRSLSSLKEKRPPSTTMCGSSTSSTITLRTTTTTSQLEGMILVPTRELAIQVQTSLTFIRNAIIQELSTQKSMNIQGTIKDETIQTMRVAALYGGQSRTIQWDQLQMATIITATSGRLLDLLQQSHAPRDDDTTTDKPTRTGRFTFPKLHTIVIDEADRMAIHTDLSEQTKQIFSLMQLPEQGRTPRRRIILCSATWPDRATSTWNEWIQNVTCATTTTATKTSTVVVTVDAMSMEASSKRPRKNDQSPQIKSTVNEAQLSTTSVAEKNNEQKDELLESNDTKTSKPSPASFIVSRIPTHLIQTLHVCAEHKKMKKLLHTLDIIFPVESRTLNNKPGTSSTSSPSPPCHRKAGIIFFNKIKTIEHLHHFVTKERPHLMKYATILHSQLHQSQRERVWQQFVQQQPHSTSMILFATDVAARGIHTPHIQFIINYDFPSNIEQYIHRCGRAGRNHGSILPDDAAGLSSNNTIPTTSPTIYSFFTRNLAPLVNDMIQLLEASQQNVDPNLRALVVAKKPSTKDSMVKDSKSNAPNSQSNIQKHGNLEAENDNFDEIDDDDDDDDDANDPFLQQLSPRRIVLARASNISDASSDSSDDE